MLASNNINVFAKIQSKNGKIACLPVSADTGLSVKFSFSHLETGSSLFYEVG